jgi:growth factor-regulated tyrosine kinase substrate
MSLFGIPNSKIFDKLLEKATSPLLLEPDWESILQICDIVKSQEVT